MELGKYADLNYKDGKVIVEIEIKTIILPEIEKIEAKIMSGELDIIKGTDLDKMAVLTVIAALKTELMK